MKTEEKNNIITNDTINKSVFNIKRKHTFKKFDIKEHDQETLDIIFGSLLGDGSMQKQSKNTRLLFNQCSQHKDYILYLHSFFAKKGYCSEEIPIIKEYKTKKSIITGMNLSYINFATYSFESFN
jgi:hypothetical protein